MKRIHAILSTTLLIVCLSVSLSCANEINKKPPNLENSVVKIFTAYVKVNWHSPWTDFFIMNATGSGVIISGNKILTNAHVVSNQKFIQVRSNGNPHKYVASVDFVSHDLDLAILSVEDESFFIGKKPVEIGELPKSRQGVLVYGFPDGGDYLSVTKGILSRIEHHHYVHSQLRYLAGQIDAAINPGNSGGPVVTDNKLVGIVMQGRDDLDNVGYMVPVNMVKQFMADIKDGQVDGVPDLGFIVQDMNNAALRSKFEMPEDETGVLINEVLPEAEGGHCLKVNDVLTSINGYEIADDGSLEFRTNERTWLNYATDESQIGDKVDLELIREGEKIRCSTTMIKSWGYYNLLPMRIYDNPPKYYIYGGLVFCPISMNLMSPINVDDNEWVQDRTYEMTGLAAKMKSKSNEEAVVLWRILPDKTNNGYEETEIIIKKVNGESFVNFKKFVDLIKKSDSKFMIFETTDNKRIILDHKKAMGSHDAILSKYRIAKGESL